MKKLLKFTLLLLALLLPATATAHDFEVNGIYYNINGTEATVTFRGTSYSQYSDEYTGSVTIPSSVTYNGTTYSVTTIGDRAFESCTNVISVSMGSSVTAIGQWAFFQCTRLTNVTIPNSVTTIGNYAFYGCSGLTSVTIPNSVTSIGSSTFYNCTSLTSATIPNSVTTIGKNAFYNCSGLTDVTIPNSVTSIGGSAFRNCTGLTSVAIGSSVTTIEGYAFVGCTGLTDIKVESGNTVFDSRNGCNAIIETASNTLIIGCKSTNIPNSVTAIGDNAFNGCTGLTSVAIPNSVTTIGNYAFYGCTGLTSVTIESSSIGFWAFSGCTGLTSVIIGSSVTAIDYSILSGCNNLTSIKVENGNSVYDSRNNCNAIIETASNILITGCKATTVPNTVVAIGDYAFRGCAELTNISIPNSVTSIGEGAFMECAGLSSINIPNSVTSLGKISTDSVFYSTGAFYGCRGLEQVALGSSILTIGDATFQYCTALTNITIPSSVTTIGRSTFYGCSGLTNVIIPNSVDTIGNSAFYGCSSLTSITIPNSVTTIGRSTFYGCSGLTSVTIPNSVITLGYEAFSYCSGLTSVTIPNSVTNIGSYAFYGCSGLTSVTIPNSVTAIGDHAFQSCTGLTNMALPNTLTSISYGLFFGCTGLTNVTIPSSVTSIGDLAFDKCSGLTNVTIPNSVTAIGNYAFYQCTGLTNVTIPNSVITIGYEAFRGCIGLTSVIIGNSVTTIGYQTFYQCTGLTSVICKADTPPTMGNYLVFDFSTYDSATLYVPGESLQEYKGTYYWGYFSNIKAMEQLQEDQFEVNGIYYYIIGDEAVVTYRGTSYYEYSNEYREWVTIPSTVTHDGVTYPVTTIGESAFRGCSGLTRVIIPNSVTTIEEDAFNYCPSLKFVVFGNSVSFIGKEAFWGCHSLTNLTFPNSLIFIGKEAFGRCTGLTSLTLPNSLKTIKEAAFEECTGLTGDLIIPESVTHLGEAAFLYCSGLTSATILSPITRINDELFFGCSGLTSVTLPNTITYLGECAFEGTALTHFTIPNAVDSIMYSAFKECTSLKSIDIPNSVTYIDDEVFWGCTSLENLTIGRSVALIRPEAFGDCPSLRSIVVADDNSVFDSRDHCNAIIETATNKLNVGCKSTVIPGTVTIIGDSSFEGAGLTSVTIPSSVTFIEEYAFCGCSSLMSVICKAITPPGMEEEFEEPFDNYHYSNATLYVPSASLQAYRNTNYWNKFTNILPIEDYATPMPTITTELSIGAMTIAATGTGTVVLMVDGVVVENPCDIARTDQPRTVRVTATAQEDGKLVSDIATLEVTIPAILPLNTDNYLSMSDTAVVRGATVTIPVRMTNAAEIISFQTDICLTDGLEVVQEDGEYVIDPSGRMTRTHSLSSNRMSNGDIRVLCYSSNYKAFTGASGDILFYITVRGTSSAEGDHVITLKNTLFTDRDFTELRTPDASATVTVLPYLKGDANGSGTVTVTDVVVTAQRVLEYDPQPFVFESADVNEDGIISVTDVSRIAWMVLNENAAQDAMLRAPVLRDVSDCLSGEGITLQPGQTRTVSITLDNAMDYTAFQLDLMLPEGLTASNFALTDRAASHALDVNTLGNGATRVLCYSPSVAAINGYEGALLTFDVTATSPVTGDITVDGIELVTTACQTVRLDTFTIGVNTVTALNELNAEKSVERVEYYNLAGQRLEQPVGGVTLVVTTYTDGTRTTTKIIK